MKDGPDLHRFRPLSLCASARRLKDDWLASALSTPPPYLPYLALFVIAAGRESPEGYPGFHKKLHEILDEPASNTPVVDFYHMWELWELLDNWSKKHDGAFGVFECTVEKGGRTHISIPLSQIVIWPSERKRLPELFAATELDPDDPPSDAELCQLVRLNGSRYGLRARTLRALSGELGSEFRALLVETLLEELQTWQPGVDQVNSTRNVRILINLCVDFVSGSAQALYRIYNDGRLPEGELSLVEKGHAKYSLQVPAIGWSSPLREIGSDLLPSFAWTEKRVLSCSDQRYLLAGAPFRIFEFGQRRGLDFYVETRRFNPSAPFLLAISSKAADLEAWGEANCERWFQVEARGLPLDWKLFSAKRAHNTGKISKAYPAFSPPIGCRIRLLGGLKAGKRWAYLDGFLPNIEIDAPEEDHVVKLNGTEICRCQGLTSLSLLSFNALLQPQNKVSVNLATDPDSGGRSHQFFIQKPERLTTSFPATPIRNSNSDASVQGPRVGTSEIPEYPIRKDFAEENVLLIGKVVGQICDSGESDSAPWTPVWLLGKGRRNLRLQFCGMSITDCHPVPTNDRKAKRLWKEKLYARRMEVAALSNRDLARLWKMYLEATLQ